MTSPLAQHTFDDDCEPGAPRLVLVHGAMDRANSFKRVVGYLPDIAVTTYDRRGYANSIGVEPVAGLAQQVDDLLAVIDGRPCTVVGHSLGGVIAMIAATQHPELVRALGAYEAPMPWLDWWPQATAGGQAAAAADDPGLAAERFVRALAGDQAWEMLPMRTQQQRRDEGRALLADIEAIRVDTAPLDLAALKVPVALAYGSESRAHHQRGTTMLGEALGVFPKTVDGAGHLGHVSHPGPFAEFCRHALSLAQ